jgi:acyl-CoA synthetase (NDP forming)
MVGVGGVFAEVMRDVTFARAPVTRRAALDALGSLKAQTVLDGTRGRAPVDRQVVADLVARVGAVLSVNDWIVEIDLNPVIVSGSSAVAADALIRGSSSSRG